MIIIPAADSIPAKKPKVPPATHVLNPSSKKIENIYKNIENEPLINRIKKLELQLEELLGMDTVPIELDELKNGHKAGKHDADASRTKERGILEALLDCFGKLLKTEYGSLGYLVKSDSESVLKLYGIDTDMEFYSMVEGSRIRISSEMLEKAVAISARRLIGESGLMLNDPAETPTNARISDDAIEEIIAAIKKRLSDLTD